MRLVDIGCWTNRVGRTSRAYIPGFHFETALVVN